MNKKTIKEVLGYTKKYTPLVVLSLILAAVIVVLTLYIPIIIGNTIDLIVDKGKVDFEGVSLATIKIVIIVLITALLQWVMNTINNRITFNVVRDIRNDAFERLMKLPLSYHDAHPYGETVSKVISDADQFADGLLMGFTQAFTGVITILGTLIYMLSLNALIALVVVIITPLSLVVARFIANKTYSMFKAQSEQRAIETAFVEEMLGNLKVVKAFGREDESIEKFEELNGELQKVSLKAIFFSSLTNPCTRFVNSIVYAAVALTGALIAINGGIKVGTWSCFLSYANQYTKPFNEISSVITELQNAFTCAGRLFDLIKEPIEDDGDVAYENPSGNIEISHVYFSYVEGQKLITDFNLVVKPGMKVAIVGPTGCGKSTLINLLMRFYDAKSGNIIYDGKEIKELSRESLRSSFGMVLQDTWLRNGTIRENISIGREDATDEEVIKAAKASHAHSFIKRLPNGYDTVINEEGSGLSQGEKQLLCIARVMLMLPPMLILDEATSSIDTRTEIKIQNAFATLMEGRTSFIVAHRLSTIMNSDIILVMKDGNIVEQGTHKELLDMGGMYKKLYESAKA